MTNHETWVQYGPTLYLQQWHVLPGDELDQHKASPSCECRPRLDSSLRGALVWDHHKLQGKK